MDTTPPQQMVTQVRGLLERYEAAGGSVRSELFTGSGHAPFLDAGAERFVRTFVGFLDEADKELAGGS